MRRLLTALVVTAALSLVASPAAARPGGTMLLGKITPTVADDGEVSTAVSFKCPRGQDYWVLVSAEQVLGTLPDGSLDASAGDNVNWDNDGNADSTYTTGTCTGRRQARVVTFEDEYNAFRPGPAAFSVDVASLVADELTSRDGLSETLVIR